MTEQEIIVLIEQFFQEYMEEHEGSVDLTAIEGKLDIANRELTNLGALVGEIRQDLDHPFFTTPFSDYSVVEGLLLLLVVFVAVIKPCINMVRRGFSWLLW